MHLLVWIRSIEIRLWYLHIQGHILEDELLIAFFGLIGIKKGKEEALKLESINKVIDNIPKLISIDLLNVYKSVQKVD